MKTLEVAPVEVLPCGIEPVEPPGAFHAAVPSGERAEGCHPPITIKIASTRAERTAAFRLVYRRYVEAGLCEPNPHEMRVTPYQLLATTTIFVASYQGEVIFTYSLVGDGGLGVPMESAFPDEVGGLREQGVTFGEISCLADRRRELSRFLPLFLRVNRFVVQFARRQGIRRFLIAVHPRHGRFHERFFAFRPLGGPREYQSVRNKPAAAYSLDPSWFTREMNDLYYGEEIPAAELEPQPMSDDEQSHFRRFVHAPSEASPVGCGVFV